MFLLSNNNHYNEYKEESIFSSSDTKLQNNFSDFSDEPKEIHFSSGTIPHIYCKFLDEPETSNSEQSIYCEFLDEPENSSRDDYYTEIYSQKNNSLESSSTFDFEFTSSHLKNTIKNNVTTSSNLDLLPKNTTQNSVTTPSKMNSLFQVIPQKSNIGLLCSNPECFNEIKILHFGKGRKKEYCSKQCFTRKSNCTRKKNCCTHFNETLLNDRKEFVKFINEGASKFNINLFYYFI
jgi:hypothetical protein